MRGFLFVVLVAIAGAQTAAAQQGYRVVQSVKVQGGELRILEDERITPDIEKVFWGSCVEPDIALFGDPRAKQFGGKRPPPARLQQADAQGVVLADIVLDEISPIARIGERLGPSDDPIFMIETDNDFCMGSYSGRGIQLYGFVAGHLSQVVAEGIGGDNQPVMLPNRLKSGWRFERKTPGDIVIHAVRCDPDFNKEKREAAFVITYTTYRFDGAKWTWSMRKEPGMWESDRAFPAAAKFP